MARQPFIYEKLLTPNEVAVYFGVNPKTVTRWAKAGQIDCYFTLGGHRRYRESDVKALRQRKSRKK